MRPAAMTGHPVATAHQDLEAVMFAALDDEVLVAWAGRPHDP